MKNYSTQGLKNRDGFTLLELLLALTLTVILVSAISGAIHVNLVMLNKQQGRIERQQVARSVMMMIAGDLRGGVQYKAEDYSGLENLVASQGLIAGIADAAGGEGELGELGEEAGLDDIGAAANELGEGTDFGGGHEGGGTGAAGGAAAGGAGAGGGPEEVSSGEATSRPTMLGSERILMVDVSRLPRVDEINPLIASAESLVQLPSDVKSVAYFYDASNLASNDPSITPVAPGGLYRRQIDRAVAAFAGDEELVSGPDLYTRLIATEVADVTFRYFDGTDWQTEWDSNEAGGFPLAIEVNVVIDPARSGRDAANYTYNGFDARTMERFRSVVHLPGAELPPEEEDQ